MREKNIATLTHVSTQSISTEVDNYSSNVCSKVSNLPICTLVPEEVKQYCSTSVDSTEGTKKT